MFFFFCSYLYLQNDSYIVTFRKISSLVCCLNYWWHYISSSSTNVSLLKGLTFTDVVTASTALDINGTLNITDNSALLNFIYVKDGNTIDLTAINAKSIYDSAVLGGAKNNAELAAKTLQTIADNSSTYTQMNGVVSALNRLSTDEQVARAVDSTTSQTSTSSFLASNQISNNVANIVLRRQNININRTSGLNSGDEILTEKNVWIKPYGSVGSQQDQDGINGFDINAYGFGLGFDGEYADGQQIGIGFFYTKADLDVNNVSQASDIDAYSFIIYGNNTVIDSKTKLLYQAGYTYQDTASTRDISFMGTTAKADYTSHVASLDLKLLRNYQVSNKMLLQPLLSTLYRYFNTPSYSETGAGSLNLDVNNFSSDEFIVGVGTLGFYSLSEKSQLFGNVNVGYDLVGNNNVVSSYYQGAVGLAFETRGIDNGRFTYDLGLGIEHDASEASNLSLSYNFQGEGRDFMNHVVSAKYTYKF